MQMSGEKHCGQRKSKCEGQEAGGPSALEGQPESQRGWSAVRGEQWGEGGARSGGISQTMPKTLDFDPSSDGVTGVLSNNLRDLIYLFRDLFWLLVERDHTG